MVHDIELQEILDALPQEDLSFGGPFPNCNAYICMKEGVLQIYPKDGGWLGAASKFLHADIAPWAD